MKIQPVAKAAPSPIPTAAEAAADPSLVGPGPTARMRRGLGALAGAGLLGSLLAPVAGCTGREAEGSAATPSTAPAVPDPADAELAARAEAARADVTTVVAPILQKALDEEGRGAFGCVAIDPPSFLSEADALDLIEQEFAKAGVALRRTCEISGFTRSVPDKSEIPRFHPKKRKWIPERYPARTLPASWTFDLSTEDGSVAVEFLSMEDEERESFAAVLSSRRDYDFPELAQRLRSEFATRTNGPPVTIGLFFEPFPRYRDWDEKRRKYILRPGSSMAALSEEEWKTLDWDQRRELLLCDARELLREQVRYFLEWARKEGRLPVPGQQPSAEESPMENREQS